MLRIADETNPSIFHEFRLVHVQYGQGWDYILKSATLPGYDLKFTVPTQIDSFYDKYSTSVYLFKNKLFAEQHIFEIRTKELSKDKCRFGYFIQLSAVFDAGIISLDKHVFSYVYYALGNIFFNDDFKQTKTPRFTKTDFNIADFFEDDIILLIICDQIVAGLPKFSFKNYLPDFYSYGFYTHNYQFTSAFNNADSRISDNYNELLKIRATNNSIILNTKRTSKELDTEDYPLELFSKHLLKRGDEETRFLQLYQVIEILISKILIKELNSKVCGAASWNDAYELKNMVLEEGKEETRISHLFHTPYTKITEALKNDVRDKIYGLLHNIGFPEYSDASQKQNIPCHKIFYQFRNKIIHNYRGFKNSAISGEYTERAFNEVNSLIELLVIEILITYLN